MDAFVSVYVTAANRKEAHRLSRSVLKNRLAACANMFPIDSLYWWKGKIERSSETGILFKTRRAQVRRLIRLLRSLHSYEVPCIVVWPILAGNPAYLRWIASESTGSGERQRS